MFFNLSTDIFITSYIISEEDNDEDELYTAYFTAYIYLSNTDQNKFYLMNYECKSAGFTPILNNDDHYTEPEKLEISLSYNGSDVKMVSDGWDNVCNKVDMKKFRINPELYRVINKELFMDKNTNKALYRAYLCGYTNDVDGIDGTHNEFNMKKVKFSIKSMNL